jgi:PKD domain
MRVKCTAWRSDALRSASMLVVWRQKGNRAVKLLATAVPALLAVFLAAGAGAAIRPIVLPGQSWDAACEAAAPGDVIPLAAGSHPAQSVSCRKSAPGVTFLPADGATVIVGHSGAVSNCLNLGGSTWVTVDNVRTSAYTRGGKPGQCGVALGRGSAHHLTLRDVDAGHIFVAGDDLQILGGDYGPTVDQPTLLTATTCGATDGSCMPQRVLIDGAAFHDYRRYDRHMECIAFYGGDDVTIRNSRFFNCAVFSIFVSGGSQLHFDRLTFENNLYERGSEAMSAHVKFSDHGATYKGVVMRNERFVGDDLLVASRSSSDYRFQAITGPINVLGACSSCRLGTYQAGSTVVTIEGATAPATECSDGINNDPEEDFLIDLADPGCASPSDDSELGNPPPPPPVNSPPVACFTRTPNPSSAGQSVTFDASCSSDSDGDALTYTWDISPGGDGIYERSGLTTSYAYASTGTKKARLRVDDGHGHVVGTEQTFVVGSG